ncbi:hypothetical protein GQ53DRAFT_721449 [Thozetella sp. PMI_491]|nr:hypothetical protein GQ53DRAFT_721449 [Thozetella sp. PMI_491]
MLRLARNEPPQEGAGRVQPIRACTNCQKRKTRCSGASELGGACSYCTRVSKSCSFKDPPVRTSLTRENLDAAESQCLQLRLLLRTLHPGLDIDAALQKLGNQHSADTNAAAPPREEENCDTRDKYEWHEVAASPATDTPVDDPRPERDGMAMLCARHAGYLGSSSGSEILQEIASLLPQVNSPPGLGETFASLGRPSPPTPDDVAASSLDPPSLASSAVRSRLIDAYFLFYNSFYPVLHEKTFRDKMLSKETPAGSAWDIVCYMVLALGYWISTANKPDIQCPYYHAARSRLSMQLLESGTMETVQALCLMGNYLQKRDWQNTAYNVIGIAYRMAIGMGLHAEVPGAEDDMLHERRRQLFWTMIGFESGFNITTGRPPSITEGFMDCHLPRNIDDIACSLSSPVPPPAHYPTTYSALIAQAQLTKLAFVAYNDFLLAKMAKSKVEYQSAEIMDRSLVAWRENLPSYFTSLDIPAWFLGPRAVVLWKQQSVRILVWRGSKRHHSFLPSKIDAERRCVDVAMETVRDITTFCKEYEGILHLGINWYATYFLFQATLVLEAYRLRNCSQIPALEDDDTACRLSVEKAKSCLEVLAHNNSSASQCLGVLGRIHQTVAVTPAGTPAIGNAQRGCDVPESSFDILQGNNPYTNGASGQTFSQMMADPALQLMFDQRDLDSLFGL